MAPDRPRLRDRQGPPGRGAIAFAVVIFIALVIAVWGLF